MGRNQKATAITANTMPKPKPPIFSVSRDFYSNNMKLHIVNCNSSQCTPRSGVQYDLRPPWTFRLGRISGLAISHSLVRSPSEPTLVLLKASPGRFLGSRSNQIEPFEQFFTRSSAAIGELFPIVFMVVCTGYLSQLLVFQQERQPFPFSASVRTRNSPKDACRTTSTKKRLAEHALPLWSWSCRILSM